MEAIGLNCEDIDSVETVLEGCLGNDAAEHLLTRLAKAPRERADSTVHCDRELRPGWHNAFLHLAGDANRKEGRRGSNVRVQLLRVEPHARRGRVPPPRGQGTEERDVLSESIQRVAAFSKDADPPLNRCSRPGFER